MTYIFKLVAAFLKKFKIILFVSVIAGLATFFILQSSLISFSKRTQTSVGVTGRYSIDQLPTGVTSLISRGLTKTNESDIVEADLASWEEKDSGREWIFTIKDKTTWQDGKPLKVSELNYEFSDVDVSFLNDNQISFKLKDPFSPFPSILTKPVFKKGLLGVGEWSVDKLVSNGRFVQELVLKNESKDSKTFRFFPTEEATKNAFIMGKVNSISGITDAAPLNNWKTVNSEKIIETRQVVTLFFNTQDKVLSDKSVRQALMYAIDKKSLGERALSPISRDSWAYNPQVKDYAYDTARSKEILKDLPKSVLDELNVKIITTPILLDTGESISKYWNEIGVNSFVQVSSVVPTDFQVYITILDIPTDPDQYPLWHSTQTQTNLSKYSNPRIDKLLEDGRSELNFEARRKTYLDFQRFLLEDVPAGFLYYPSYYTITRK